jgi:hypothetical protein
MGPNRVMTLESVGFSMTSHGTISGVAPGKVMNVVYYVKYDTLSCDNIVEIYVIDVDDVSLDDLIEEDEDLEG